MKDKIEQCPPHKYRRRNISTDKSKPYFVFKCLDCPSYVKTELAVGLEARCYKCNGKYFVTAKHASDVAKPTCPNCVVKSSKTKAVEAEVDSLIEALFKDM